MALSKRWKESIPKTVLSANNNTVTDVTAASKKITASLLLIAGLLPLLLPLAVTIREKMIEMRMEEKLEDSLVLQTIVIPEKDVIWMDKHEIWVNEQMFDISSKKLENGIYTFTGLYDKDETMLVKQEKESSEKNNSTSGELAKVFQTLLQLFYQDSELRGPNVDSSTLYPFFTAAKIAYPFRPILTPPPQNCNASFA